MAAAENEHGKRRGRRRTPDETRLEILGAARAFLRERPFREMTVEQLMRATSVGRSSFYRHFDDLYELVAALLEVLDDELPQSVQDGPTSRVVGDAVEMALAGAVGVWQRNGPVLRAIAEASTQDARLEELYRDAFMQRSIHRIRRAIQTGQGEGWVDPSLDPAEVAALLAFMTAAYLSDRVGRNPKADPALPQETIVLAWKRILRIDEGL